MKSEQRHEKRRLETLEVWFSRCLLKTKWFDKVISEEVLKRIDEELGKKKGTDARTRINDNATDDR